MSFGLTKQCTKKVGAVIWFTGLPCSGKSTVAEKVSAALTAAGHEVEWLDGDAVRSVLPSVGFGRAEREQYLNHIAFLCSKLEQHGVIVVASFVSPYSTSRELARQLSQRFIEVYVSTPLSVCEARDTKGLYRRARVGEVKNFTGVSDPYEAPSNPELTVNTNELDAESCVTEVLRICGTKGIN